MSKIIRGLIEGDPITNVRVLLPVSRQPNEYISGRKIPETIHENSD